MFERRVSKNSEKKGISSIEKPKDMKEPVPGRTLGIRAFLIPLLLAVIVTVVIWLLIDRRKETDIGKTAVYCASREIPAHTHITANTVDNFFHTVLFTSDQFPEEAVQKGTVHFANGYYTEKEIHTNEMLLIDDLTEGDEKLKKYEDGYSVTSIAADSFKNSINGTVRRGDIIQIYARNPATDELEKLLSDVYVEQSFDQNGNLVTESNGIATSFTVRICKNEIDDLNLALCYGDIHLYR